MPDDHSRTRHVARLTAVFVIATTYCLVPGLPAASITASTLNVALTDLPDGWHQIEDEPQHGQQANDAELTRCMGLTVGRPGPRVAGPRLVDGTGTQLVTSTVVQNRTLRRAQDVEHAEGRRAYPACLAQSLSRNAQTTGGVIHGSVKSQRLAPEANSGNAVRLTYVIPFDGADWTVYLDRFALRHGRNSVNVSFSSNNGVPPTGLEQSVLNRVRHRMSLERV